MTNTKNLGLGAPVKYLCFYLHTWLLMWPTISKTLYPACCSRTIVVSGSGKFAAPWAEDWPSLLSCAGSLTGGSPMRLQEQRHGRKLQQLLPPLPVALPLPPFLTGGGPGPLFPGVQQPGASLQTQPRANASANGGCTATFAGVLASQPDLFFLSSALGMSGFANSLPSPSLGLTIFAPSNAAFLKLLNQLSAPPPSCSSQQESLL